MNLFDVLDRRLSVNRSYFLEASAGTGKTFAIEHLVVRQLIEGEMDGAPISIDQILVVTFTRAAARELRARIHASLEKARSLLRESHPAPHDYLRVIQEGGESCVRRALHRLESALSLFDEASIGTIHSFCLQALCEHGLEAGVGFDLRLLEEAFEPLQRLRLVRDFFRIESGISPAQLQRALGRYRGDLSSLERAILNGALSGQAREEASPFAQLFDHFIGAMKRLVGEGAAPERLRRSFLAIAADYRETCDRSGLLKPELRESLERFLQLFAKREWEESDLDLLIEEGVVYLDSLDPSLLKQNKNPAPLEFGDQIGKWLAPLVAEARDPERIVGRLIADCQKLLQGYLDEEEVVTPDRVLELMSTALERPAFQERLLRRYRVAIIDEFQDTDPTQWRIFSTLFGKSGRLILVGDPKQSIYAFRKADIYCYLEAMQWVGESNRYSLQTNYRSLPELVEGINRLFSRQAAPALFSLPRSNRSLSAQPCAAGIERGEESGVVHFFIATGKRGRSKKWPTADVESDYLFPFVAREIVHHELPLGRCAILVRDWEQGERIRAYLNQCGIRAASWRKLALSQTGGYLSLRACMEAALFARDLNLVRCALATPAIGWTSRELEQLAVGEWIGRIAAQFASLGQTLVEKGVYPFFDRLMGSAFGEDQVLAGLLRRSGGKELYQQMRQIACRLAERQLSRGEGATELLNWLLTWEESAEELPPAVDKAGVQILTIHASKGLEFDVVFALGVVSRTTEEERNGEEVDAEKGRQLYVALTRGRKRVYVPIVLEEEGAPLAPGTAAPIELLMARLGESEKSYKEVLEAIPALTPDLVHRKLRDLQTSSICWTDLREPLPQPSYAKEAPQRVAYSPEPLRFSSPGAFLHSFTTLSKKRRGVIKGGEGLPSGAEVGNLLHRLLERVDLTRMKAVDEPDLLTPWVVEQIRSTLLEGWEEEVASLVWRAFHTPVAGFRLVDLSPASLWREMEFYHPYERGAMVGVVDLFFEYEGRYYLADWKSNWLPEYDEARLREEMEANDYFLQAHLYQEAVKRLIALCDKRPFEECFGGIYYLFLRGLDPMGGGVYRVGAER